MPRNTEEWARIAKRWKFLDLYATLMSGERDGDEVMPVVTLGVAKGVVRFYEGAPNMGNQQAPRVPASSLEGQNADHGLPQAWIDEFCDDRLMPIVRSAINSMR